MDRSHLSLGTSRHQQILATITAFYEADDRVLALLLFGSLSRGNWDQYSDIDLDVVMSDNILIDARVELQALCTAIKQKHDLDAIIIADVEEGDVVLSNLVEFSIRYHILSDTKPAILDTMHLLSGSLSLDQIRAGVNYAYQAEPQELGDIVNAYLRYMLAVHNAIIRQNVWMAVEMLYRIRALLMLMYALDHEAERPLHFFDAHAPAELQALLSSLTPPPTLTAVADTLPIAISVLENNLAHFSKNPYHLTANQRQILDKLKQSQATAVNTTAH